MHKNNKSEQKCTKLHILVYIYKASSKMYIEYGDDIKIITSVFKSFVATHTQNIKSIIKIIMK